MPINAGPLSAPRPIMDFMFEVLRARSEATAPSGGNMSPQLTWTLSGRRFRCDVLPLKDEFYFAQVGGQTVATHIFHFFAQTDILPNDRVMLYSSRRLGGPVGTWYNIVDVVQPTETIMFIRCHARTSDPPPGVTVPNI